MHDSYVELIVKRKTPLKEQMLKVAIIIITVIAFLIGMVNQIVLIAAIGMGILAYFLVPRFDLEYEYILINNELDIDKIMSRTRRKRVISYDLTKMVILAPLNSHHMDYHKNNRNLKAANYSSLIEKNKKYAMVIHTEKENQFVIFEPDKNMLNILQKNAPRKVFID
jgi:hypothetical protein